MITAKLDKKKPVLINSGCTKVIKDNIAPRKAVRFFISKFTFNQYTNFKVNKLLRLLLKEGKEVLC